MAFELVVSHTDGDVFFGEKSKLLHGKCGKKIEVSCRSAFLRSELQLSENGRPSSRPYVFAELWCGNCNQCIWVALGTKEQLEIVRTANGNAQQQNTIFGFQGELIEDSASDAFVIQDKPIEITVSTQCLG